MTKSAIIRFNYNYSLFFQDVNSSYEGRPKIKDMGGEMHHAKHKKKHSPPPLLNNGHINLHSSQPNPPPRPLNNKCLC